MVALNLRVAVWFNYSAMNYSAMEGALACPCGDFTYCTCAMDSLFEDQDISMCPKSRVLIIKGMAFHSEIPMGIHFLRGVAEGVREGRVTIITDLPKGLCTLQLRYTLNGRDYGISFYLLSVVNRMPITAGVLSIQSQFRFCMVRREERRKKRMEAVAMGLHPRLGSVSPISCLTEDLLGLCVGFC